MPRPKPQAKCLFCRSVGRCIPDDEVIASIPGLDGGYLIQGRSPKARRLFGRWFELKVLQDPAFVIIPHEHIPHVWNMPGLWQRTVNELLLQIPGIEKWEGFTVAASEGKVAGAEIPGHIHFKVIRRAGWETGRPSENAGTELLVRIANARWWHRLFR